MRGGAKRAGIEKILVTTCLLLFNHFGSVGAAIALLLQYHFGYIFPTFGQPASTLTLCPCYHFFATFPRARLQLVYHFSSARLHFFYYLFTTFGPKVVKK